MPTCTYIYIYVSMYISVCRIYTGIRHQGCTIPFQSSPSQSMSHFRRAWFVPTKKKRPLQAPQRLQSLRDLWPYCFLCWYPQLSLCISMYPYVPLCGLMWPCVHGFLRSLVPPWPRSSSIKANSLKRLDPAKSFPTGAIQSFYLLIIV